MDRKAKLRIFGKLLDAGFDDEKKVMNFQLKDLLETDIRNDEVVFLLRQMQQAVKNHKVIAYFADKAEETGQKRNGGYENEG